MGPFLPFYRPKIDYRLRNAAGLPAGNRQQGVFPRGGDMWLRWVGFFCMTLVLAACANRDIYSGDVYSASQAKTIQTVTYGTIVSARPVKRQEGTRNGPG